MNEAFIIAFITQRMKELGFTDFHYESVKVNLSNAIEPSDDANYNYVSHTVLTRPKQFSATKFHIMAHNEFYFLVERNLDVNLTIIADNDQLTGKEAADYSNTNLFQMKEFTGQIFLETTTSPGAIDVEFIKCTPYTKIN